MTFKAPKLPDGWVWEVNIVKTDWEDEYRAEIKAVETATGKFYLQRIQFSIARDGEDSIKELFLNAAQLVCTDTPKQSLAFTIFSEIIEAFNEA